MKKLLLLSILIAPCSLFSQTRQWTSTYDDPIGADDIAYAIVTDAAGNSYITGGISETTGAVTAASCGTIKYNNSGAELWVRTYNPGPDVEFGRDLAIDGSGNLYVAGQVNAGASADFLILKYSNSGTLIWNLGFDGGSNLADAARAVTVDNSGNVYVTGQSTDPSGDVNIGTVKYNSSGAFQWSAFYNGDNDSVDFGTEIKVDAAGNVYVLGNASGSMEKMNYVLIKYDASGTQLWATEINGSWNRDDIARAMVLDGAGNAYVTGTILTLGEGNNVGTVKINSGGTIVWLKEYQGTAGNSDEGFDIALDAGGNVIVTGTSLSNVSGWYDAITIKYDNSGNQVWAKEHSGTGSATDRGEHIAIDASGNIFITGQAGRVVGAPGAIDYLTMMYDTNGNLQWADEFDGTGNDNDIAFGIALDPAGNAIVTGWSTSTGGDYDIVTIKYCTLPGMPGAISGDNVVCEGESGVNYSVASISGASSYAWTLPTGASIASGSGTNSVVLNFATGSASGNITVAASNSCGNSSPQSMAITVNPMPTVTYVQSPAVVCSTATVVPLTGVSPSGGTFSGTAVTGTNFNATVAGVGSFPITYSYTDGNSCTNTAISNITVSACTDIAQNYSDQTIEIYPNPSQGNFTLNLINLPKGKRILTVYDALGKMISTQPLDADLETTNIELTAKGLYFISLQSEGNLFMQKVTVE